jgi:hypothetical protein
VSRTLEYGRSNFLGGEIGHLLSGAFLALASVRALKHHMKRDYLGLQYWEGKNAFLLGIAALITHLIGNHGSVLIPLIWPEDPHLNWMKDQQHVTDLLVWISSGFVALVAHRFVFLRGEARCASA